MVRRLYIGINQIEVIRGQRSVERLRRVIPKLSMLMATSPGFLGFQTNYQVGILPLAGRYGGAAPRMALDPLALHQYTVWSDEEAYLSLHRERFARLFELYAHCFPIIADGPWEPTYLVVAIEMPMRLATPARCVAVDAYTVNTGRAAFFEQGLVETMAAISRAPGFLGYMLLKQIGVNPWGSFRLDPASMMQLVETLGAVPPSNPQPLFEMREAQPSPLAFLLHTEWESPELAQLGLGWLGIDHEVREIYTAQVLPHTISGPYIRLFRPVMENPRWRRVL